MFWIAVSILQFLCNLFLAWHWFCHICITEEICCIRPSTSFTGSVMHSLLNVYSWQIVHTTYSKQTLLISYWFYAHLMHKSTFQNFDCLTDTILAHYWTFAHSSFSTYLIVFLCCLLRFRSKDYISLVCSLVVLCTLWNWSHVVSSLCILVYSRNENKVHFVLTSYFLPKLYQRMTGPHYTTR